VINRIIFYQKIAGNNNNNKEFMTIIYYKICLYQSYSQLCRKHIILIKIIQKL